jgi:hypothetical protein
MFYLFFFHGNNSLVSNSCEHGLFWFWFDLIWFGMVWFGLIWFGSLTSLSGVRELFPLLSKRFDTSAGLVMHKSIQTEFLVVEQASSEKLLKKCNVQMYCILNCQNFF